VLDLSGLARVALILLVAVAASAPELATARTAAAAGSSFLCRGDVRFHVAYARDGVRITTSRGSWWLARRPSSVGRKFQSQRATFIHDGDMAALNGLPGGPFRGCREEALLLTGTRP
jgi:hypothetical protein